MLAQIISLANLGYVQVASVRDAVILVVEILEAHLKKATVSFVSVGLFEALFDSQPPFHNYEKVHSLRGILGN